jgi:ribonuclease HI
LLSRRQLIITIVSGGGRMKLSLTKVWIDGSCLGNPGKMGIGIVINDPRRPEPLRVGEGCGRGTNNIAEYQALIRALRLCGDLGVKHLQIHSDSELLVKQMNGEYKVRDPKLQELHGEAEELRGEFLTCRIVHIRREQNWDADALAWGAAAGGAATS